MYRIDRLIGTGGMGSVYRAEHAFLMRDVALKVLREDQVSLDRAVDRMMREAAALATIAHGGIPRFFECGMLDDGRPWIAMELIAGTSLQSRLARGALAPADVIALIGDVAEVLAAAHERGITHRDLKPDNVFLVADGGVRLLDFGIAACVRAGSAITGCDYGTPSYVAPEQLDGGVIDAATDIWALGVVLYEALTGLVPTSGRASGISVRRRHRRLWPLEEAAPDVPPDIAALVNEMLTADPASRPSLREVRAVLAPAPRQAAYSGSS